MAVCMLPATSGWRAMLSTAAAPMLADAVAGAEDHQAGAERRAQVHAEAGACRCGSAGCAVGLEPSPATPTHTRTSVQQLRFETGSSLRSSP